MASNTLRTSLLAICRPHFIETGPTLHRKLQFSHLTFSMAKSILAIDTPLISLAEATRFMRDCLEAAGASKENASVVAENLATADYRGHYSHGMNRLELYIQDIKSGNCDGKVQPKILKESPSTAWIDGMNGLGAVVGKFAMETAINKAKTAGVGWVSVKGSNHYGIAGIFAEQARKEGLLGMSFTNTSPLMCPTRAKEAALGTNPLALAAPGKSDDAFVLDMATTAVAVGKIEIQRRKKQPLPEGWALNENGQIETDPDVAYKANRLMPLGGPEINSGYKGTGLGMLVEIFCGILSGSTFGPNIRKWGDSSRPADLGHCFIALNPSNFAPDFEDRMSDLMNHIRQMEPMDPTMPVLVAGDPERQHMKSVGENGGLRYVPNQMMTCEKLAKQLNVKRLQPLEKACVG